MIARVLNDRGIEEFAAFLVSPGATSGRGTPEILDDDFLATPIEGGAEVEMRDFANRFDLARYLCDALGDASPDLDHNRGLWSWLALFYFDQLCPLRSDGTRKIGEAYRYILSKDYRHYYRHLLAMPYVTFRLHGKHSRTILFPPVHKHGDFAEQLASRQELITNRGLIQAVDYLYFAPDATGGAPKRGATNRRKGGTLRRLVSVIQQLDLTYDLYGMNAWQILDMLPHEFDSWIRAPRGQGE